MIIAADLRFELLNQIGGTQGRNSVVYIAHDKQLDAQIVVKRVEQAKLTSQAEFFAEAQRLYYSRHPNVVDVKYACQDADHVYLAMPYYERGSLHTLLEQRFLTVREIVKYGLDFLQGLHHVHVKDLVHLDVKPTNILVGGNNVAALADFGISKNLDPAGLAQHGSLYGRHLPPEGLHSTHVGRPADIYQAGLTLYRMCNGLKQFADQAPATFSGLEKVILAGTFPNRKAFLPHIPKRLRKLITGALELKPDDRQPTILDLMNQLAVVDQNLDCRYTPDSGAGIQVWEVPFDSYTRRVELVDAGGVLDVVTTQKTIASGKVRRISAGCRQGMVRSEALKFVEQALA